MTNEKSYLFTLIFFSYLCNIICSIICFLHFNVDIHTFLISNEINWITYFTCNFIISEVRRNGVLNIVDRLSNTKVNAPKSKHNYSQKQNNIKIVSLRKRKEA